MSRFAYVNGRFVRHNDAVVQIEDRGYQFADGVYEAIAIRHGRFVDLDGHLERFARSLDELAISHPMDWHAFAIMLRKLCELNGVRDGFVYAQITRGVARRDHPFPAFAVPAVTATARRLDFDAVRARADKGIAVKTVTDIRWARRDIKSISLLPNVLAKQAARESGAYEAVQVMPDGTVTEGSSTNVWMVNDWGELITHPATERILNGITMQTLKRLAEALQIKVTERAFTIEEAQNAKELLISSTTAGPLPIVSLDGAKVGDGAPGPVAKRLFEAYWNYMETA